MQTTVDKYMVEVQDKSQINKQYAHLPQNNQKSISLHLFFEKPISVHSKFAIQINYFFFPLDKIFLHKNNEVECISDSSVFVFFSVIHVFLPQTHISLFSFQGNRISIILLVAVVLVVTAGAQSESDVVVGT